MILQTGRQLFATPRVVLFFLLALALYGCGRGARCVGDISEVNYHVWTGHLVPSWSEDYVISTTTVRLTRTGEAGSEVNAGTWEFDVDPQRVALLFDQLKTVKWSSIRAIPPEGGPAPDGGGSTSYRIKCERDTGLSLSYYEGRTYAGGEAITRPIKDFVASLTLPADAGRFVLSTPSD